MGNDQLGRRAGVANVHGVVAPPNRTTPGDPDAIAGTPGVGADVPEGIHGQAAVGNDQFIVLARDANAQRAAVVPDGICACDNDPVGLRGAQLTDGARCGIGHRAAIGDGKRGEVTTVSDNQIPDDIGRRSIDSERAAISHQLGVERREDWSRDSREQQQ